MEYSDGAEYLGSKDAAAYLGVKVSTLYAYVSRGLLESVKSADNPRQRRYRKSDLDRLKQKSDSHAGESAAAAGALRWGAPSLDTAVSEITPAGPRYRGHSARGLVRDGVSFESAAELLWTGELPSTRPDWQIEATGFDLDDDAMQRLSSEARPLDRMRLALGLAELDDLTRFGTSRDAQLDCARRIIATLAGAVASRPRSQPPQTPCSIASLLSGTLCEDAGASDAVFDAALVAVADHELNAATFATRVAASTGASLYASVAAGLCAASGPRHGGACERGEALIDEVVRRRSARQVLLDRLQRGESVPGFGHPLYPHGDPRWTIVVSRLGDSAEPKVLDAVDELVAEAGRMRLGKPTVDLALATLCRALGLPQGTASAIFSLGRVAGLVAHSLEQQEQGFLLRPRANYVGP